MMHGFPITVDNPIGEYVAAYLGWSKDESIRRRRVGSGGAVTSFLIYLLEEGAVDGVVVAKKARGLSGRAVIARSREDVIKAAGNKWDIVPYTVRLRDVLSSPELRKVGVVGLPCQALFLYQMRIMPLLETDFAEKIELIISLFCLGTFATEAFLTYLSREHGISPEEIESVATLKDKIVITLSDGGRAEISVDSVMQYMKYGCLTCSDYTVVFADLSAGVSENHLGKTVLIARNDKVQKLLEDAREKGYIELVEAPPDVLEEISIKARAKMMRSAEYLSKIL